MRKVLLLALIAGLGVLSGALVFAGDNDGPYRVVITEPLADALRNARKKAPNDFWDSADLTRVLNQLDSQGYDPVHVYPEFGRLHIIAKKR